MTSARTKAATQPSSSTNPRKVAAAAKARAALAAKRAREKTGELREGGRTPQIGAAAGPFPPSLTAGQNFSPNRRLVQCAAAVCGRKFRQSLGDDLEWGPALCPKCGCGSVLVPQAQSADQREAVESPRPGESRRGDLPLGAMSEHDAPNAPFVPPPQPVVTVLKDGRKLVR